MKETGLIGKRRSTTIAATPDNGKRRSVDVQNTNLCGVLVKYIYTTGIQYYYTWLTIRQS